MHIISTPLLVALVVLVVLAVVVALLRQLGRAPIADAAYEAAPALLTPAERSFFGVLQQAVATDYQIFAKVRLADIVRPARPLAGARRQAAFNRISAKHADFVLCESQTLRVVGVIELDDSSHARSSRQARDGFVDSALAAAGIGILRVSARQAYSPAQLREQVEKAFRSHERVTNNVG
jgi:very-short-patch-repair endonuclease